MSIEEWAAMPEDEPGELVDGYIEEEEVADYEHETIVSFVNAVLRDWAVPRGGFVAGSEAKFAVGERQGRKPDLSVYLPGGSVPPRRGPIRIPPDIAIEVVSPNSVDARRDRVDKVRDYAAFGIRWYWIIESSLHTLEVFKLREDGHYAMAFSAIEGGVPLPDCEGLSLDLDALWTEVERLGDVSEEGE